MNTPEINPEHAVDLKKVRADSAAEKKARENAAEAAALQQVAAWDRAMTRAFKGIVSRPNRHMMLEQSARRLEREAGVE